MKLPRRKFLHLAAGAAALPTIADREGAKPIRHGRYGGSSPLALVARRILSRAW